MKKAIFKGCGTALATPFDKNNEVNYEIFGKMIEDQIKNDVDSLIVCGTTGESSTMTEQERKEAIKFVVEKSNGRVPVIAGTGSNNTKSAVEMTKYAESIGCDGALVVTPYYNKTTQLGLIEHYKTIANETKLPIVMYSVKSRTGVNIEPETAKELSKVENIVAIKEASGDLSQIAKIINLCEDNLSIYSGNDDQVIPILSLGGIGVISVLSNIEPKYTHEMCKTYFDGDFKKAGEMQIKAIPLINALFCEVNPTPVKFALKEVGFDFGKPRLPLTEPTETSKKIIKQEIEKFNK
ncbi:MAG: 4-hydroxy-tetrahydrodipicolinate synthase [Clostridia bacterium]|nr:4-hydroxy-tetrahydrodipicolinate synthase [Clostridia bacterium]